MEGLCHETTEWEGASEKSELGSGEEIDFGLYEGD
jgi:hypothetical protein